MTALLENSQSVRTALENLQMLLDQLRGQFVNGINGPDDYARAAVLLDELTDGHELNKYEEQILIDLEDAIQAYEKDSQQFKSFNASFKRATPVQLLRDLMETLKLTGSDLPEIGDKTAVSKVLSGDRPISHKMAFALAERFHMDPKAFISESTKPAAKPVLKSCGGRFRLLRNTFKTSGGGEVRDSVPGTSRGGLKPVPKIAQDDQRLVASSRPRKPSDRPSAKR